jgi:hypothetical protein
VRFISHHGLPNFAAEAGVTFETALAVLPMDFTEYHSEMVGALRAGLFCKWCRRKLARNPKLTKALASHRLDALVPGRSDSAISITPDSSLKKKT